MLRHTHLICFNNRGFFVETSKLIYTSHDDFIATFHLRQALHPPAFSSVEIVNSRLVIGNIPVGTHNTVKAKTFPEKVSHQVTTITTSTFIFTNLSVDNSVIRHDSAG